METVAIVGRCASTADLIFAFCLLVWRERTTSGASLQSIEDRLGSIKAVQLYISNDPFSLIETYI